MALLAECIAAGDVHAESRFIQTVLPGLRVMVREYQPSAPEPCQVAIRIIYAALDLLRAGDFSDFEEADGLVHALALAALCAESGE